MTSRNPNSLRSREVRGGNVLVGRVEAKLRELKSSQPVNEVRQYLPSVHPKHSKKHTPWLLILLLFSIAGLEAGYVVASYASQRTVAGLREHVLFPDISGHMGVFYATAIIVAIALFIFSAWLDSL
jgi:hypothetical protein